MKTVIFLEIVGNRCTLSKKTALFLEVVRKYMHFAMKTAIFLEVVRNRCTLSKKIALFLAVWWYSRHHHRQIRQPALLSKLRSSAQGSSAHYKGPQHHLLIVRYAC
jgi:hypothetical protein